MSRKLVHVMTSVALAVGLVAVAPLPVRASCSEAKIVLWEDGNYSGDGVNICYAVSVSDLASLPHTPAGSCNGGGDNWNNCVSSWQFFESTVNTTACLYSEVGYVGLIKKFTSNGQQETYSGIFPPNDWASSVRFGC